MTPTQTACYDKWRMLRAEARAVEKRWGGNSTEMNKILGQINAAITEYVQSQPK